MPVSGTIRVAPDALLGVVREAVAAEGVPDHICRVEAEVIVEAELLGVPSHGLLMLPRLVRALRDGRATRDPRLTLLRDHGATCVLDGDNGPGRYVAVQAMQHAVERARRLGAGVCLATRTTHWGRAHAYACRAAWAGMIGVCTTNAIPNMLAFGSTRPLLGNDPLAIGVPRGRGRDPIVLDIAMSQAAVGKIATHRREGVSAPLGWGLDRDGRPTEDPAAILASGNILPMGGHKGAGLALMLELLTGALGGELLSHEVARLDASGLDPGATKLFLAIDVLAFVERERFEQKVEALVDHLRTSEPGRAILLPGERGWQTRDRYRAEGIPIHPAVVEELAGIGVSLTGSRH
jgi:LDH2 family malate/lactate/ureidoglycolate dehydrogenase